MNEALDLSHFARPREDGVLQMELAVEGIACGGCIARIEGALKRMPGVVEARVNFTNRRLTVAWIKEAISPGAVIEALDKMGYGARPFAPRLAEDEDARAARELMKCLATAGFAAMNIMLLSVSVWSGNITDITPETRDFFHWLSALIAVPAVAYAGRPFLRSALGALRARSVNMDVPISLGVLLAVGMSLIETINHAEHAYFDSAVMLLFFLLCGRYLDHAMRRRTRAVAGNLAALRAEIAQRLERNGDVIEVPAAALEPGDRIVVRPGDRLPADGVVVDGTSEIDESLVTGETAGRTRRGGEMVYAGSLNLTGALTLRVTAAGERTLLDEVERLLEKAVKSKSRYVRLADRAARCYAPVVHTAAAATLGGWLLAGASLHDAVIAAISVLIITCPCALALAVPAVQVVAAGRLFRNGVILNAGDAIERLAEIDTVVFDKTGTLTLPEGRVANAAAVPPDLLELAARLGLSSRHPLAAAVAREARDRKPFPGVVEDAGQGVRAIVEGREARLGSASHCRLDGLLQHPASQASIIAVRHGERWAVLMVDQALRPDAVSIVGGLRARGLAMRILSGDRRDAIAPIAAALGISDWQAGLTPDRKVEALKSLAAQGHRVLMVGDGINDAPSLAQAHVSMSPISAAELSQAHADAVFLGAHLAPVLESVLTARAARRLMLQNLSLAAVYNLIAIPIAVAGLVTPLIAALAMSGSSLLVTANALRLRLSRRRRADEAPQQPGSAPATLAAP
ncbi:MAG TPA: heavy metal translocating P-type ATPase [Xanthobacteraceae bacterium]